MTEVTSDRKRYMDCARAVCMLYIVGFWHLFDYTGKNIVNPLTSQITYGVLATFTFISGYFLGKKKITDMRSVFSFWGKRLVHFYPLFVISCILLRMTGYIWDTRLLVLSIGGLSCIIQPAPFTAWYLCMLIPFYFVTPLINSVNQKKLKILVMLVIEIVMILAPVDSRLQFYWVFYCTGIVLGGGYFG